MAQAGEKVFHDQANIASVEYFEDGSFILNTAEGQIVGNDITRFVRVLKRGAKEAHVWRLKDHGNGLGSNPETGGHEWP